MERFVWCPLSEGRRGAVLERRKCVALELPPRSVLGTSPSPYTPPYSVLCSGYVTAEKGVRT